jgi:DNA-binding NarL/FixJ family response regulator
MYKILIADDFPATSMGTKFYLEQKGHHIVSVCSNGIEAYHEILSKHPNIAIIDMSMPGMTGMEILEKLNEQKTMTKIIFYTMHNEISIFNRAMQLGAKAYLIKDLPIEELGRCIHEVGRGYTYICKSMESKMLINNDVSKDDILKLLTFAERKILEMIANQKSTKQIAEELFITEKTVGSHRSNITKKLSIPSGNNSLSLWAAKNWK